MIIPISYPLDAGSPLYPGTPETKIVPVKSIEHGDSANTSLISLSSHAGTHIDVPRHFCRQGQSVKDLFRPVNSYSPVYCIDVEEPADRGIRSEDLVGPIADMEDAEGILIRTGMWQVRNRDPEGYSTTHPWIHASVARLLREKCPHLRILGIDLISISSPSYREEGRESHRAFLCDANPILLLEDADLSSVPKKNRFILTVLPWFIEDLDGVPVTAFLEKTPV